jgi:integrase
MLEAGGQEMAAPGLLPGGLAGPGLRRAESVIRSLRGFGAASGLPASAACLLDYDVIEAFCVTGLRGRAAPTRGTYRSVLYSLAGDVHGPPSCRATPFAGAKAPPPYSLDERAGLISAAGAQRGQAKRTAALAMVWFGIGAGLRPGELAALRGTDVAAAGGTVAVHVAGPAPRTVPVTGRHGPRAEELARGAGDGFVFRPGPAARGYKNFVNGFAGRLAAGPAEPRLSMGRCRASFICDHLAAGTPPGELLAITGIREAGSLARYARHVEGAPSRAVLRAWDRSQRAR